MRHTAVAVFLGLLLGFAVAADAQEAATPTALPLESVRWAGAPIDLESFQGKSVLLFVYATWCPKCNEWSGELMAQLRDAASKKPVIVLAINADESPSGVQRYITQRAFFGPNIIHGYDPNIHKRLGLDSNLFHYVLLGPTGAVADRGRAGSFQAAGAAKRFVLPQKIAEGNDLGDFQVLQEDMSEPVRQLLWPMELGGINESALKKARGQLTDEQKEELNQAIFGFLDRSLAEIKRLNEGKVPDQIVAFEKATVLATLFKTTEQSQEAQQLATDRKKDRDFQREIVAKKVYERTAQKAGDNPAKRATMLRTVAKRCEGTYYGDLAKQESESENEGGAAVPQ